MIELSGISKRFALPNGRAITVLDEVDLTLSKGEVVAVMGPSGSGKTTLLNLVGLVETPDAGEITIDGELLGKRSEREVARLRGQLFGFVFQQFHLLPRRSARQNVIAPILQGSRTEISRRHERATDLLKAVGLEDRSEQPPESLSGGEQQRVALARALARRPRYILADEPTGSLDKKTGNSVLGLLISAVRDRGCGMLLSTHDDSVASHADRLLTLQGGLLSSASTP